MSAVLNDLDKVKPVFQKFRGWRRSVTKAKAFSDFPDEAQQYIEFLTNQLEIPISIISVGPQRNQIIKLDFE